MAPLLHPLTVLALFLAALIIGHDLYARRVPNVLIAGTLLVASGWQIAAAIGWVSPSGPGLAWSCIALVLALITMLPLYAIGWMGAGDVKLMAILGFLLGLKPLLIVWLLANAIAGAQTVLTFVMRFALRRQPQLAMLQINWQQSAIYRFIERPRQGRQGMPFAAYLGIGVFVYVFCFPLPGVLS